MSIRQVINFHPVSKSYNKKPAMRDFSLQIEPSERIVVMSHGKIELAGTVAQIKQWYNKNWLTVLAGTIENSKFSLDITIPRR